MAKSNKNLHLTLSDRQIIQGGIENGSTKASIAETLGKDKSTIGKETRHIENIHIFAALILRAPTRTDASITMYARTVLT
mgnify:CR=1 FL=1